jgi:regulator of replication initiation timing
MTVDLDGNISRRLDQIEAEDGDVLTAVTIARALLVDNQRLRADNQRLRDYLGSRYAEISGQTTGGQ